MKKIDFKDLNEHIFVGKQCVGFDIKIGEQLYVIMNIGVNDKMEKIWKIKSYDNVIPDLEFEVPCNITTLLGVAKCALRSVLLYVQENMQKQAEMVANISEMLGVNE